MDRKTAIVTGGIRGIGHGISEALSREQYNLAIFGRSDYNSVKDKIEMLQSSGINVFYYSGDMANTSNIKEFVELTVEKFGKIDLLVNNAGVAPKVRNDILELTEESYDFVTDTNTKGTFFMTQAVAKTMANQGYGTIINISSISAYTSSVNRGEYCISKAGISMITTLFADRMAEYGVRVYEIRPGIIKTDMTSTVTEKYDKMLENGLFPIKRWGYPEDIAMAVKALADGALRYSTGEVINIDGGFHLRRI